jgi:uncharacterized protein DUF397
MDASVSSGVSWRKSSFSAEDMNCVEAAMMAEVVGVRDSKDVDGPVVVVPVGSWARLVAGLRG